MEACRGRCSDDDCERLRKGAGLAIGKIPNGRQVIRDSQGGALVRTGRTTQPVDSTAAEQSAKLAAAVTDLESLLNALGQSIR